MANKIETKEMFQSRKKRTIAMYIWKNPDDVIKVPNKIFSEDLMETTCQLGILEKYKTAGFVRSFPSIKIPSTC